jgi:hypothetical protein
MVFADVFVVMTSALVVEGTETDDVSAFAGGAAASSCTFNCAVRCRYGIVTIRDCGVLDTSHEAASSGYPSDAHRESGPGGPAALSEEGNSGGFGATGSTSIPSPFECALERLASTSASRVPCRPS